MIRFEGFFRIIPMQIDTELESKERPPGKEVEVVTDETHQELEQDRREKRNKGDVKASKEIQRACELLGWWANNRWG